MSKGTRKWSKANQLFAHSSGCAVALKYSITDSTAPQVSVKGSNIIAEEMKAIARKYGVPIHKSQKLASKLTNLEVSSDIPRDLYDEVAKVFLSFPNSFRGYSIPPWRK